MSIMKIIKMVVLLAVAFVLSNCGSTSRGNKTIDDYPWLVGEWYSERDSYGGYTVIWIDRYGWYQTVYNNLKSNKYSGKIVFLKGNQFRLDYCVTPSENPTFQINEEAKDFKIINGLPEYRYNYSKHSREESCLFW